MSVDGEALPEGRGMSRHELSRANSAWILILLMLAYTSSYLDRTILGVLQEPIKRDLGLSDGQLGLLGGLCQTKIAWSARGR